MKKKNITLNIDKLIDKMEIHTDNNSRGARASQEEIIHQALNKGIGLIFSHSGWFPKDKNPLNIPQKQTLSGSPVKGSINVQDFQKLHVNEWLRLVHMLDSLLPETELRVLYRLLLELKETDRGKILRKGVRRMTKQSVQKQKEISEEQQKASFRPWHKNFQ